MAKYIDAEKVIAALTDTLQYEGMVMDELISVVANIPAADVVERKTGNWIHNSDPMAGEGYWNCSECGLNVYTCTDFCPNCGSEMR